MERAVQWYGAHLRGVTVRCVSEMGWGFGIRPEIYLAGTYYEDWF